MNLQSKTLSNKPYMCLNVNELYLKLKAEFSYKTQQNIVKKPQIRLPLCLIAFYVFFAVVVLSKIVEW